MSILFVFGAGETALSDSAKTRKHQLKGSQTLRPGSQSYNWQAIARCSLIVSNPQSQFYIW
jgi:hypothetical protein